MGQGFRHMTPGERIKELRLERGWTQKELARKVGNIDHSGVSNIERGAVPIGDVRARRFAQVFRVKPEFILPPEGDRATLGSVDSRLRGIEALMSSAIQDSAVSFEALGATQAAIATQLDHIEALLKRLAPPRRGAKRSTP